MEQRLGIPGRETFAVHGLLDPDRFVDPEIVES